MRILQLTTHLNYGGVAVYTTTLASTLAKRGHEAAVASSGGDLEPSLGESGVRHHAIRVDTKSEISPKLLVAKLQVLALMKQLRPDVLHAHTRVTQVLAHAVSTVTRVPYVTTCHGFFRPRPGRRLFPCWGERVIAISDAVEEHLVEDFHVDPGRVRLVYNGIDLDRFRPEARQAMREAVRRELHVGGAPVIGIVGRLSRSKGHLDLLEAFAQLRQGRPEARLLIVGDGDLKQEIVSRAEGLGIEPSLIWVPGTDDTARYLAAMDVFVFPTLQEGLGLALMEAQAAGVPVVATRIGGVPSLVEDGVTGWLVAPSTPGEIAAAVGRYLENPESARTIARQAAERVRERFSLDKMVDEVLTVYGEVVSRES